MKAAKGKHTDPVLRRASGGNGFYFRVCYVAPNNPWTCFKCYKPMKLYSVMKMMPGWKIQTYCSGACAGATPDDPVYFEDGLENPKEREKNALKHQKIARYNADVFKNTTEADKHLSMAQFAAKKEKANGSAKAGQGVQRRLAPNSNQHSQAPHRRIEANFLRSGGYFRYVEDAPRGAKKETR